MQMLDANPNSAGAGGYQQNQNSQPQQNSSFSGGSDQGGQVIKRCVSVPQARKIQQSA